MGQLPPLAPARQAPSAPLPGPDLTTPEPEKSDFETPAFPVENYAACVELTPVTDGDRTFAQWWATFDEAPEDRGKYAGLIADQVFAAGPRALGKALSGAAAAGGGAATPGSGSR